MLNYFNVRDINHFILTGIKVKVDYDLLPECSIGIDRKICSGVYSGKRSGMQQQ